MVLDICTEPEWCKLSANTKSCSFLPGIKITCERSCKPCKGNDDAHFLNLLRHSKIAFMFRKNEIPKMITKIFVNFRFSYTL